VASGSVVNGACRATVADVGPWVVAAWRPVYGAVQRDDRTSPRDVRPTDDLMSTVSAGRVLDM